MMLKKITTIFLVVFLVCTLFFLSQVHAQTIVFSDGYENGYTPWYHDSHVQNLFGASGGAAAEPTTNQGGIPSIQSSIVHSGSYAFRSILPANLDAWAVTYKLLSNYYATIYMSSWAMFSANIPNNGYLLAGPCLCGYNDYDLVASHIHDDGGTLKWTMEYSTNSQQLGILQTSNLGPAIYSNIWYFIEIMVTINCGAGEAAMWVNGIKIADATGLSNDFDKGPSGQIGILNIQIGGWEPPSSLLGYNQQTFTATTWHDDVTVSTIYIPCSITPDFFYAIGAIAITAFAVTGVIILKKQKKYRQRSSTIKLTCLFTLKARARC